VAPLHFLVASAAAMETCMVALEVEEALWEFLRDLVTISCTSLVGAVATLGEAVAIQSRILQSVAVVARSASMALTIVPWQRSMTLARPASSPSSSCCLQQTLK
jgi:hypothetical protein